MLEIKIPATSANIGPGFDSLGIALTMYATLIFDDCENELEIIGCEDKYINKDNLIYVSYLKTFELYGEKPKNISINIESDIPPSRGLGSSSVCVVGGVAGALYMMGKDIDKETLLSISTMIEGHPDNVSPAIYGGLTASLKIENEVYTRKFKVDDRIVFYAFIPSYSLSTTYARNILPKNIKFTDAIFNISRIPLLIKGFEENDKELISISTQDALHQPYRKELIPEYELIEKICCNEDIHSVYLSGAGPTIMCISDNDGYKDIFTKKTKEINGNWKVEKLFIDINGTLIKRRWSFD